MKNIEEMLKKYDFFWNKKFEIYSIQDYGRNSKFKIKMEEKYYTLILTNERIIPYINKFKILGDNFKKIIGFQYLSEDKKVLVLDYFGNNKGIDLIKCDSNITPSDYDGQLKEILDSIHSNKQKYVDFSDNNFKSWQEYYLSEIKSKIISIYNQNLITNDLKEVNKPTLILAHNKTLAGQLYAEFKELFSNNHVEFFVSYYSHNQIPVIFNVI